MYPDQSLKENIIHGTPQNPIHAMHFTAPCPECFFVDRHWHNYVEILFITKGSYRFEINLENFVLTEGDICFLNSGDLHRITGDGLAAIHEAVLFDPKILDFSYSDEWEASYCTPFLNRSLIFRNILRPSDEGYPKIACLLKRLLDEALYPKEGWYLTSKLLLLEIFVFMASHHMLLPVKDVMSPDNVRKILRYKTIVSYIEEHYQEPVSLRQLADAIPCNSQYLCRFFKEIAGVSPVQYLISYRLERACALLLRTASPVTEIALDCGFENISYFIRKFKAQKGCTPGEYRHLAAPSDR